MVDPMTLFMSVNTENLEGCHSNKLTENKIVH